MLFSPRCVSMRVMEDTMRHEQELPRVRTVGRELRGEVVAIGQGHDRFEVIVRLNDGTLLHVPTDEPLDALGGTFYLPVMLTPAVEGAPPAHAGEGVRTFGRDLHGEVVGTHRGGNGLEVIVRLDDGRELHVPTDEALDDRDGLAYVPVTLAPPALQITQVRARAAASGNGRDEGRPARRREDVLPLVREEMSVGKRTVETGSVRVATRTHEHEELVDVPLRHDEVEIERVPVNRVVEAWVPVRTEGDVTVIPVLEETMVVQKRLLLKEEVRVRLKTHEEHKAQRVRLRREDVAVERTPVHEE